MIFMLKDLKILNGYLELEYHEYIYEYTVTVTSDINQLEFDYKLENGWSLSVRNNTLKSKENYVYVDVYNNDTTITYTFLVYKENNEAVSSIDTYLNSLEINIQDNIPLYKVQILSVSIFLILVILFSLIFKTKRKN